MAQAANETVGATLFDFRKFFDAVDPCVLAEALVSTEFPEADCALAMQMHWAPRLVQVSNACGPPIRIDKSILPGCYYSIPLVDALMYAGSNEIVKSVDLIHSNRILMIPPALPMEPMNRSAPN